MAFADDLLAQAQMLANLGSGVPGQANLRRAASAAYYALFHLLISEAVQMLVPARPAGLGDRVSRTFSHSDMKRVCARFTASRLPDDLASLLLPNTAVSPQLISVAEAFESLQEWRHIADYDVGFMFLRSDALATVGEARQAFLDWAHICNTDEATVFLTALAFGARWSK